jgi:phosphocarrier protein
MIMHTIIKDVTLTNQLGLHARPSAKLTQLTSQFKADVYISKQQKRVNAKSIMGVMMLAASFGQILKIEATGEDAQQAIDAIVQLFANNFGESQ